VRIGVVFDRAGSAGDQGCFTLSQAPPAEWAKEIAAWRGMSGVTYLSVHTVGLGLKTPAEHVKTLEKFREEALR